MTGHGTNEPSFLFIESSHTYQRGGIILPGATRCLDHAGLTDYENVRADILERRSILGKHVHSGCHFYDEKDLDWSTLDDEQKRYIESWGEWREARRFNPAVIEHQQIATVNGMSFGMRLDRYGLLDKVPTIVEIKTTREIQDYHAIQTAFYAAGYSPPKDISMSPMARFLTRRRIVVQLRSDGKIAKERMFDDRQDFEVMTWALGITTWKLNRGRKIREIKEENNA
jgi:hypothetical protein